MSRLLSPLHLCYVQDTAGAFLKNRDGRQLFKLLTPFSYQSDVLCETITVPSDFVTDLASIPRWPIVYIIFNGDADEAGVIHDYAYSTGTISRLDSDKMLREACLVLGVPAWKAWLIYQGVRLGGSKHYAKDYVV